LHAPNLNATTTLQKLLGMKMQPKKLRSFAFSTSGNKKILPLVFSLGSVFFYAAFFHRASLYFPLVKK
jgi:hypothetical protein